MGPDRPHVLIIGTGRRAWAVGRELSDIIQSPIKRVRWCKSLPFSLGTSVSAIVVVGTIPEAPMRAVVQALRKRAAAADVGLFVVVQDGMDEADVRQLYRVGATAVFEWPRERKVLPRCILELLSTVELRCRAREPDTALARAVRAHLRLLRAASRDVHVRVRDGYVFLSGRSDSLWQKPKLRKLAAEVPGVVGVIAHDLEVPSEPESDRAVSGRVNRLPQDTSANR